MSKVYKKEITTTKTEVKNFMQCDICGKEVCIDWHGYDIPSIINVDEVEYCTNCQLSHKVGWFEKIKK